MRKIWSRPTWQGSLPVRHSLLTAALFSQNLAASDPRDPLFPEPSIGLVQGSRYVHDTELLIAHGTRALPDRGKITPIGCVQAAECILRPPSVNGKPRTVNPLLPRNLPQHLGVSWELPQERKQAFDGFDWPMAGQASPDSIDLLQVVSWDQ
jgi:hypothetical protein